MYMYVYIHVYACLVLFICCRHGEVLIYTDKHFDQLVVVLHGQAAVRYPAWPCDPSGLMYLEKCLREQRKQEQLWNLSDRPKGKRDGCDLFLVRGSQSHRSIVAKLPQMPEARLIKDLTLLRVANYRRNTGIPHLNCYCTQWLCMHDCPLRKTVSGGPTCIIN